jgi:hypothetical protein
MKFAPLAAEDVEYIVIHCSYTRPSQDIGVEDIRRWHRDKGWLDVGYHAVIRRDGTVEPGRAVDVRGAHCLGYNDKSIGICLVGGLAEDADPESQEAVDNFTPEQMSALNVWVTVINFIRFPNAKIVGHRDLDPSRECPGFEVSEALAVA